MPIWGGGLVGKKEDKRQSKSWQFVPILQPLIETPKEAFHACCLQICAVHSLHNPYSGTSIGPLT